MRLDIFHPSGPLTQSKVDCALGLSVQNFAAGRAYTLSKSSARAFLELGDANAHEAVVRSAFLGT